MEPHIFTLSWLSLPQEQHIQIFYPNPLVFFLDTKQIGVLLVEKRSPFI